MYRKLTLGPERFVVEPCVAIAYREWRAAAGATAAVGDGAGVVDAKLGAAEPGVLAKVKARAGRMVNNLAGQREPLLAAGSPALRRDTYDVFRQLCVAHARLLAH